MNKILVLIIAIIGIQFSLFAQTGDDELTGDKVDVLKTFEAQLDETEKVDLVPQLPPLDTTTQEQVYNLPTKNMTVEYPAPRIRPIAMRAEDLPDIYNTYLKLGGGIPSTFYGEGSYNKFVDKTYDIGLNLKHHSGNFSKDEVEHQKFAETRAGIGGTYYFDQGYAVNANMSFNSDIVHYYGFNFDPEFPDTISVDEDDVKQRFNTFALDAKVFNGENTAGDINYSAGFDFYNLNDNFSSSETGFAIILDGTKWINGTHAFNLGIKSDFTSYEDTVKQKLNNFHITPNFTYHGDFFMAKVGVNLVAFEEDFSFFPNIELAANVTGSELSVFAGAEGTLQKNTFRSLSDYNPYIASRSPALTLRNTKYFHYYGGIKGNIKIFEYRAQIGLKTADNLALFVRDSSDTSVRRRFRPLYDNVNIVTISGTVKAEIIDGLELLGTVGYNVYDPENEEKAWHLPALEINGALFFTTLEEKLRLKASLFIENGVPIPSDGAETVRLNSLFDLSFGAEYLVNERIGVFFDLNNLLDNERERWEFYPTYGLNVLLGVSARF